MTLPSTVWCVRERAALALGHSGTAIGAQPLGTKLRLVTASQQLTVCPLGATRDQGPRVCQQAVVALDVDEVRGHAVVEGLLVVGQRGISLLVHFKIADVMTGTLAVDIDLHLPSARAFVPKNPREVGGGLGRRRNHVITPPVAE